MQYDYEQITELCENFDLLSYVQQQYETKRRGNDYMIHCPLHRDDTPSLAINSDGNKFYCHSCRVSGSILQWLMKIEGLSFNSAVEKVIRLTGTDLRPIMTASSLKFFKTLKAATNKEEKVVTREILSTEYMDQFEDLPDGEPKVWIEEGISQEMIRKYGIKLDRKGNRVVYPVYDNDDNLIGVKGRTLFKEYKVLGLKKYINYTRVGTTDYFQGMHENRNAIIQCGQAIVFEGIKSCMKADGWGYPNCISAETSLINDAQARILIQMGVGNVVIAFDNDVPRSELLMSANKLKRYVNVDIIQDKNGLAGDKSAPVDNGKEVWEQLLQQKQRII